MNADPEYFSESLIHMQEAILHHVKHYSCLKNLSPCKHKVLKRVSESNEEEIIL